MRIKQIELNGFKSFMERTVLELPLGVTAIVGPNGCGKSNIVDAIRWVLGEQSPKHLRGAAMEDVVFGGNADSGPVGMAEVSLLLERDEEDFARIAADAAPDDAAPGDGLPPEIANVSEILVTRRYFRSGESEYFINRAPCRLRDITELFLGTGVGTRAYAIIEQGRVDQLINAKPEELRLFIEEAAGTTRFRSRKLTAERKMQRTRENLVRVQDVLHELERQRASLERQARRAEEYHRIKDELRDLDLRVIAARHRTSSAELDEVGRSLGALQGEEASLHEEIDRTRGTSDGLRAARTVAAERLRAIDAEITEQRVAAGEALARATSMQARAGDFQSRAEDGEREEKRLRERLTALTAEEAVLTGEVERLGTEQPAVEASLRAAEARVGELTAAGTPIEQGLETQKDSLLEALAEQARLRNLAEALRERRGALAGRRQKLDDEQRLLGDRLREHAQRSEAARVQIAEVTETRARLAAEREGLVQRLAELEARERAELASVEQTRVEVLQLRSRAESFRELQSRSEGCTRGVASVLARGDEAVLLASLLRVPPPLERAVAAALGARLSQVVVPNTTTAVATVDWLGRTSGGRATVLPRDPDRRAVAIVPPGRRLVDAVEVDPRHWALAEALLGQVLLADTLAEALVLWREASHPVIVVTPAGEAIDTLGAITGGSEAPLEETLLVRERELRELTDRLAVCTEHLERAEATLAGTRAVAAETTQALAALDDRLQGLRIELVSAEKDRERLQAEHGRIGAELEAGALEARGLAGEDGELTGELAALEDRVRQADGGVSLCRARLEECQMALGRWREDCTAAERARTDAAVRAAAVVERLRAVRTQLDHSQQARADLEERLGATTQRVQEATAMAASARQEAAAAADARTVADARVAELELERQRTGAEIAQTEARMSADDASERDARARLETARERRTGLEIRMAERRMELDHLAAQLTERYGLGVEVLRTTEVEDDGRDDERAARVEGLRARLLRLGDVNPAAVEELEELRTRHEFLAAQRADLERSLEDLRRTITKLDRTSRQRFEETFDQANEKLAEVFPKLFPGGKARLEATIPEEGGEPGIEIVVQPAGKKLQSLSLLSGGEKALTAVGLILSLFLIRPTPFCLLDEVDAPLDEANIGRFNQLIREMAATSQFVLITHNRRTMEVADTLYGITMEQAGVSKVVSVRLREAA